MRRKRSKIPIQGSLGKLAERAHFKDKHRTPLRGWYRPAIRSTIQPLKVDYSHR